MDKTKFLKLIELSGIVCFGVTYWQTDLRMATLALIISMSIFVGLALLLKQPLSKLQWVSWISVLVLGSVSLLSHDDMVIKWKPTVIHLIIGLALWQLKSLKKHLWKN